MTLDPYLPTTIGALVVLAFVFVMIVWKGKR